MASKLVSAIMMNFGRAGITKDCIRSLQKSTYPRLEVILVNNSTADGSELKEFCKKAEKKNLKIRFIQNQGNIGYARGNNLGFANSRGEYILLINNDTVVARDAISFLVRHLESDGNTAMVGAKILRMDGRTIECVGATRRFAYRLRAIGKNEPDRGQHDCPAEVEFLAAVGALLRRQVVEHYGLFDSRINVYGDDLDLCWRYRRHGLKLAMEPRAKIRHYSSATMGSPNSLSNRRIMWSRYLRVRNSLSTCLKNGSVLDLLVLPVLEGKSWLDELAWSMKSGRPEFFLNKIKSYLWNAKELPNTLAQRFSIRKERETCLAY